MRKICLVLALAGSLGLIGCNSGPAEDQAPVIRTGQDFEAELAECQRLSQDILLKVDLGQTPSAAELDQLKKAEKKFQGLIAFRPEVPGLHLGLGRIHQVFSRHEDAIKEFSQGADYIVDLKQEDAKRLVAEFHFQAANSYAALFQFKSSAEQATKALSYYPDNAKFLTAAAGAYIQLNEPNRAKLMLQKALKSDPHPPKAEQLMKLLESGAKKP